MLSINTQGAAYCQHTLLLSLQHWLLQIINDIRNRTGARVNLFDEERHCGDRMLQASGLSGFLALCTIMNIPH